MGELHEKGYFHLQPVMLINEYNCLHFSEMDRLIKYKTDKTITLGEKFLENRYKPFGFSFNGKWKYYGSQSAINSSNSTLLCDSCVVDFYKRHKNYESAGVPRRSYQVPGHTNSSDLYEWEKSLCSNNDSCFGRSERIFQVKRHFKDGSRMMFSHNKIFNSPLEENVSKLYVSLDYQGNCSRYTGINSISTVPRGFFWPGLFIHDQCQKYFFHVELFSGYHRYSDLQGASIKNWPTVKQYEDFDKKYPGLSNPSGTWDRDRHLAFEVYANQLSFHFYQPTSYHQPVPENQEALMRDCKPHSITHLEMYPGGKFKLVAIIVYNGILENTKQRLKNRD